MNSAYDFAKTGRTLHGYTSSTTLGYQAIKPVALDELADHLKPLVLKWEYVKFAKINQDMVPSSSGIYFFVIHPKAANIEHHSIVLYFGRTKNLAVRFCDYLEERYGARERDRQKVVDMLTIYRNRIEFAFARIDYYETERIEDLLIDALGPCCNTRRTRPSLPSPAFNP